MKRKLFLIGLILLMAALVAGPVAALAETGGNSIVSGQVSAATISITPPSAINLGNFTVGDITGNSMTPGTVIVTAGTAGYPVTYSIRATDGNTGAGRGYMMNGTKQLSSTNKFFISADGISYKSADETISYNGTANDASAKALPLYVKQTISGNEPTGTFQIAIAFTASIP